MKKLFGRKHNEEHNFWMSYTDLMSGFLVIFIIASYAYKSQFNEMESKIDGYPLDSIASIIDVYDNYKDYIDLVKGYSLSEVRTMVKLHNADANLVTITKDFEDVFKNIDGVEFVDSTESIRFYPSGGAQMMFEVGEYAILPNLSDRLKKCGRAFVQRAMELINQGKNIAEIRIEGHTDITGDYFNNVVLSSNRAYAVYYFLYHMCGLSDDEKTFVKKYMISVGYSSQKQLDTFDKSRRIEFKIIAK